MNDLKHDYFKRDLSDAEFEALGQELESSPESAERFAGLAADAYQETGLPEPRLGKLATGRKALIGLVLGCLAGLGLWACLRPCQEASLPSLGEGATYSQEREPKAQAPAKALRQAVLETAQAQVQASLDPDGKRLWVAVHNPRDSEARLRLLTLQGKVIAVLHQGKLASGEHRFSWDCQRAATGSYRLELLCDGRLQTRRVRVLIR